MSDLTPTYLLDKNIARKFITCLYEGAFMDDAAVTVLLFWDRSHAAGTCLLISPETANILRRFDSFREVHIFLASVEVLRGSRYFKRWARRLRAFGFTGEDAELLALGTFGTDEQGAILGVDVIITLDQRLMNNYQVRLPEIQARLSDMTAQLPPPFCHASLPEVLGPEEILEREG